MAALTPFTVSTVNAPSEWDSATNGDLGDLSDSTYGFVNENQDVFKEHGWIMDDVNDDLITMTTLFLNIKYGWAGAHTNTTWEDALALGTRGITAYVVDGSGTTQLAGASSSLGDAQEIVAVPTATSPTQSGAIEFAYVNTTANEIVWNSARVVIGISRQRAKGGSTTEQRIYEAEFTGTYEPGAAILPNNVFLSATPGSLVVTTGSLPIVPAAATVTATPGSMELSAVAGSQDITPAPVTVTVTPATMVAGPTSINFERQFQGNELIAATEVTITNFNVAPVAGGGKNFYALALVTQKTSGGPGATAGVTIDGEPMVQLATTLYGVIDDARLTLFGMVNPPSGTVEAVATSSQAEDELILTFTTYSGVDQVNPVDTAVAAVSDNFDNISVLVATEVGDLVVGGHASDQGLLLTGDNGTVRVYNNGTTTRDSHKMSEEAGGATIDLDLDMNWATVRYSGGIAVNLNQADVNDYIHLGEGTRDIAAANQLTITSQVDRIGEDTTTQFTKAVGWTPAVDTTVDQITVSLLETGTIGAGDIWFEIWDDDAASPGTLITGGTTATKPAADIDGTSWDHFDLPAPVTLIGGNTYYIVAQFDFAVSSSNYLRWRSDAAGVAGFDGWTIHQDDTEAAITASPSLALRGANTDAGISVTAGSVVVTKGAAPIVPAPITVTVSAGSLVVSVPGGADQAVNLAPEYELLTDYFEHNDLTTDWGSPPAGMSIAGGIVTTAVDATNDAPKLAQSLSTEDQADVWVHYRVRINSHTSVDTDYVQGFGLWGTASFFKAFLLGFINVSDELFLRLTYQPDAGQVTQDGSIPLDLGTWYDIKVHWVHATAPAADNGTLTVWVNNVQEFAETGIDNDTHEGDYFTIGNNFRSVMDITYDLDWIGVSAFEPIGHVVGVTPGSMILTTENAIVPAPVTVTVSAGSMVVTTGSVPIVPAPVTVNVTPGTTVLTGANAVVPAPITVTVTTGSMVVTTGSVAIVPAAATVTATPGSLVVTQPVAGFNIFWLSNSSNPSGSDNTIINHLESAGHTVTTESDQASPSPPTDILTYDLVILSEAVAGSSAPGADYLNTDIPLLSFEAYCLDEMEMAGGHTDDTAETDIEIVDDTHLIAGGLANGTHTITNSNTYNWQSSLGPDFHLVGETVGGNPLLGYYDEGDEGTGSFTMPNKRAFFTIRLAAMSGITATGLDIVDGIVEWLMDAGGPAAQNIVPAAATVTATPGSMAVTVGSLPIVPAVVTVTVTEGSVVLTGLNPIVPAVATVSATAGSLAVTTGSLPVIPAVVNVTATGSTLTVTVGSVAIVPDPHTVTATPSTVALTGVNAIALTGASVSVSAGSVVVTTTEAIAPAGASVSVTPSTVVVTVGSVPITPDAVTVTVTEGSLVVTTGALPVTPAAASVSITAGSMVLNTHQNITLTGASVSVTPSTLLLNTIQSITPGAQSVDVTAGSMTLTVGSLPVTPSAASVTITAGSLVVVPAQLIALTGPTVTVTPAAVVITTGSVPITPDAVTVTVTPQSMVLTSVFPVVPSAAVVSVTPQALTVTVGSLPIVPAPHSVTATSGSLSVTVGAAPIALTGADVTATASTVTLTGLNPVSPVAASVAVLPSTLTVTTGSVPIVPDAATVNVSAGSVAVTTGAVNVVPDAATVTVTSGSMALTTGAIPISTAGASVTVTAGSLTLLVGQPIFAAAAVVTSTSGTMTITTGSVDITLTGATVAVSGGTVATSEPGDGNANTLMMMGLGA